MVKIYHFHSSNEFSKLIPIRSHSPEVGTEDLLN
ncbi:hypothetical protein SAMN05421686_101107 [Thalassolituus maritimus]|uniref:Uncharacterized protein n=1 Tax=Thalassolituus maritimus TaxID=484498 RepID=A0A1N7IXH0_9GAMM|nr:hypothetical protein SAMN05421686_101107 [Thalassolituus maritimus]